MGRQPSECSIADFRKAFSRYISPFTDYSIGKNVDKTFSNTRFLQEAKKNNPLKVSVWRLFIG